MADQKISQLTDGTSPQDGDEFPIARGASNFSLTWAELKAAITTGVSSVFGRTGAVVAQSGDYTAAQVTNAADKSSSSQQAFTGEVKSPDFVASGLTGATQATRYVGATTSGAPVSGTFAVGDYIVAQNGHIFVCTVAGSPGTWVDVGSAGNAVTSVFSRTGVVVATSGDYTAAQVTNAADKSSGSQQNFIGEVKSPDFVAAGLTGATAASRYVGATASGAPASGTFAVGDYIIDQTGFIYVCTVAGSPGTWTKVGGGGGSSSPLTTKGDIWGYNTADARIPVGSDGQILTADSTQALGVKWAAAASGGASLTKIFDQTLSVDAASIDTGAAAIPSTYTNLVVYIQARTGQAAVQAAGWFVFNNDTGSSSYVREFLNGNQGAVSAGSSGASSPSNGAAFNVVGSSGASGYATAVVMNIPNYAGSTFYKTAALSIASIEPTNSVSSHMGFTWVSTSAISQIAFNATGNVKAGSRMTIYGMA